ncbi:sulfotransferase family protein [Desulfosediminicola flagellatus]|uniref:sulfotransferase family protein n=1 Tax=Desulfosediminicola flagellatus TaxID=2569541 RepID=UPI0010AC9FFE|nr:sulfotransferase domain-containing protein [Desulfosediminicola flagellatus]
MINKPNFFIIGAAKAATTSLWMYLKQHPEIFMPEDIEHKEPSYFCNSYGVKKKDKYLHLFESAKSRKVIGDASNAYLTSPESAKWINEEIPDAKIIVILRNPVDRAYSLYRWMVSHGYEWIYPFEKALKTEFSRKDDMDFMIGNPQYYYNYLYFGSGMYFEQLERYYKTFPIAQIKIILLDEIKRDPVGCVRDTYRFLDVDDNYEPTIKIHNKGEFKPVSIKLHFMLRSLENRYRWMRKSAIIKYLFRRNQTLFKLRWETMQGDTKTLLQSKYRADIENTSKLIGRDLSSWYATSMSL